MPIDLLSFIAAVTVPVVVVLEEDGGGRDGE